MNKTQKTSTTSFYIYTTGNTLWPRGCDSTKSLTACVVSQPGQQRGRRDGSGHIQYSCNDIHDSLEPVQLPQAVKETDPNTQTDGHTIHAHTVVMMVCSEHYWYTPHRWQ